MKKNHLIFTYFLVFFFWSAMCFLVKEDMDIENLLIISIGGDKLHGRSFK